MIETARQPYQARFNKDRHPRIQPALHSVSITGPYNATGISETPSRKRIFACRPARPADEAACAKTIVTALARRAYRRPATNDDVQTLLTFYQQGRADGGFDYGVEMALRALLVSPKFLFRVEEDPANVAPNTPYRLSDLELASRLSFFLWSSIPDDELLDVAARGKLSDPATLERQVRRMLADRAVRGARHQLRLAVAVSAEPRDAHPGSPVASGLRRQPPSGLAPRNGAVLSEHHRRGPERRWICCGRTTRFSTSGWPSTTAFPMCTAAASGG